MSGRKGKDLFRGCPGGVSDLRGGSDPGSVSPDQIDPVLRGDQSSDAEGLFSDGMGPDASLCLDLPLCQWFPAGRSPGNGPAVYGKPGAVFLSGVFLLSDLVEDLGPSGSPSADGRIPVPGDPPGKGKKAGNRGSHR